MMIASLVFYSCGTKVDPEDAALAFCECIVSRADIEPDSKRYYKCLEEVSLRYEALRIFYFDMRQRNSSHIPAEKREEAGWFTLKFEDDVIRYCGPIVTKE
jgi:hypothetical protein